MTFKLGLTGSIGMGKSTTANLFVEEGCSLWDADASVHRLYSKGGAAVSPIADAFPDAIEEGAVSRHRLKEIIADDNTALRKIEQIVHPLVAAERAKFLSASRAAITVLDIPLLFETGSDADMDATVCVWVSPDQQEARVLSRGSMTQEQFEGIRDRQMASAEKCARADYVIETDTLEHARQQVQTILRTIRERLEHA